MQRLGTKDGQNALEKEIPLGRMGKKSDIASMAVFLFSEEGESYSFSSAKGRGRNEGKRM